MCHCFTVWLVLVILDCSWSVSLLYCLACYWTVWSVLVLVSLDCSWSVSLLYCLACTRNIGLFTKCVIALLFGLYSSHWTVHEECHCFTVWLVLVILDCSWSVCYCNIGLFMKCVCFTVWLVLVILDCSWSVHCFTVWLVLVILDCSWSVSLLYCLACTRNIGLFMKCVIALLFGLYS